MADTIREGDGRIEPTLGSAARHSSHAEWRLPDSGSNRGVIVSLFRRRPKPAEAEPAAEPSEPRIERAPGPKARPQEVPAPRARPGTKPVPETRTRPEPEQREVPRPAKPPKGRRSLWASPITRRILLLNVMALAIPVVGLLYLPTYRDSLIQSELELLKTEGELFSGAIAASGVVTDPDGSERLQPDTSRQTIRRLVDVSKTRARLFLPNGTLVADSFLLSGPGGILLIEPLPPPEPPEGPVLRALGRVYDWLLGRLPASDSYPAYGESAVQVADDYQEVTKALSGETSTYVRSAGDGSLVLSVAVPVQRYRQVLGALFLTKPGKGVEVTLRRTRLTIIAVSLVALGITVLASLYLASTIALPIHRLADAADRVRRSKGRSISIPDLSTRSDEIGDLSGALRDMTQAVWRRMDAIERFAADVAHEIKNPLSSLRSAVETVARIEDPQQQRKLMGIILDDVQRLDRLISDISDASRVDAEMSRAEIGLVKVRDLIAALVDIHTVTGGDAAPKLIAEMPAGDDLTVLGAEGRLGQVFRNLLSNALSFSPPGGKVTLRARRDNGRIVAMVEDEGPGIPEDKLKAIFDRFYSERPEGEKFGTHSGLGLSISQQIVEAHNGTLTASNRRDRSGKVIGARFTIDLPAA
ncbi:MAG TPA: stimulus-sensing domain-containing protein [Candidatus Cybelea sp.]|nr:stimulus-sensing domain-containing protein [Candidatus Cybelea sp.]